MSLPLVRNRASEHPPVTADVIAKCIQVATTPEVAELLFERVSASFGNAVEAAVQEVVAIVENHANNMRLMGNYGDTWSGKRPSTPFENYQEDLAAKAAKALGETQVNVVFDYAISNASQFLRAYSSNGNALPEDTVAAMDKLFNAWLAENNMISKGGVIYEATEDGQIKTDANGNPVRADAQALREKIRSNAGGFQQYLEKNHAPVKVDIQQQPYPEQPTVREEVGPS